MSEHIIPATVSDDFIGLLRSHLGRTPPAMPREADGTIQLTFDPDLTPAEQATLDTLVGLSSSQRTLTPTEYDAVRTEMQTLRDLRQLGRNAFVALSDAEQKRKIYDALVSQTIIDLAILRD